jgi:D-alanyl-D-alanine carboxypeptidase
MPTGRVPGPLGVSATSGVVTTTAVSLGSSRPDRSREQFKQAVLEGQIRRKQNQGKSYFNAVPDDELAEVESGFRMRKEAAQSCQDLLRAARTALEIEKRTNNAVALRTAAIGVCSAYRDYNGDATAWSNTFNKHYDKEGNRVTMEAMPGGRHGDTALRWFIELMAPIKAPPGFSNHSNGLAVDFSTTVSGVTYGADTDKHVEWQGTWLHPWLVANAKTYRFNPLSSEEWHWDWA